MIEGPFLGTGTSQGVPVIGCRCPVCLSSDARDQRLRTSFLLSFAGSTFVIDPGPDFRQQMLREGVMHLDGILVTHEHNDHVAGMDDVRPFNFMAQCDMPVYAAPVVLHSLRSRYAYAFDENPYPGAPRFALCPIEPGQAFRLAGIEVVPFTVWHGNAPVMGFRIGDLSYVTDAKDVDPLAREIISGSRVFVINALRRRPHHSHLHLEAANELISDCRVGEGYLTHISHEMGLHEDLSRELPAGVTAAFDGLRVSA